MDIQTLLEPASIAIVGASRNPTKIGHIVIQNLQDAGYAGAIYPVNPHTTSINNLPVYKNIHALPEIPDLCIFSLPASIILEEIKQAITIGCRCFVVFTAGFKEIGEEGAHIEKQLQHIAKTHDITLLGPNCLGFIHTPSNCNASFAQRDMLAGSLRIISQSGAVASALFDWSAGVHVGIETCLTIGNKAVLNEEHILTHRAKHIDNHEDRKAPIGLYLESISDGKASLQTLSTITTHQPVILLKPGKSAAAKHAMQSHTGSIAGEDKVLQAMCAQSNTIRVDTIESFFNLLMYSSRQPAPKGKRIAIITNAGGPGVIATDLLEPAGLQLAEVSEATKQKLYTHLPRTASVLDPIDVLGDAQADRYAAAIETVIDEKTDVDAIIVILTPQIMTEIKATAATIARISKQHNMPIVCTFIGQQQVHTGKQHLWQQQIPCYDYPRQAVEVLGHMAHRQEKRIRKKQISTEMKTKKRSILPSHTGLLDTETTNQLLHAYSIPTPASHIITNASVAKKYAATYGYPVVLKLVGPELIHKIDNGGVIMNIQDSDALEDQVSRLILRQVSLQDAGKKVDIQLQQQITEGVECILGVKRDKNFGPVLMFGAGGTYTELFKDHRLGILPLTREQCKEMIEQSPIYPLLCGYRGRPAINIDILLDLMESFGALALDHPRIEEAEINPIILTQDGARAVDPKILLG